MEKLRIGIIGTGGISNSHVKAYQQMEDVEIVAGADIVPGKAREALDRWNLPQAKAFENTQEMLDTMDLDAVSVCTYNTAHAECAIQALRAGCHVLLEKPMTVTLEDRPGRAPGGEGDGQNPHHRLPAPVRRPHAENQGDCPKRPAGQGVLHPDRRRTAAGHPRQHLH